MSYILDALKRSEQERHQEKLASIDNDMMVMSRRIERKPLWPYFLALGLIANAAAFVYLSFNDSDNAKTTQLALPESKQANSSVYDEKEHALPQQAQPQVQPKTKALPEHLRKPVSINLPLVNAAPLSMELIAPKQATVHEINPEYTVAGEEIIRPKKGVDRRSPGAETDTVITGKQETDTKPVPTAQDFSSIPLISEKPIAFQRQIPSLTFNSHIYSTEPSARRAMINNVYLREGDGFSGLTLEEIGEFYVVLSYQGQDFKTPVLKDWQAP